MELEYQGGDWYVTRMYATIAFILGEHRKL
jgi:hypothetical protein